MFINTTREIVLGLDDRTPNQHTGGIVRNNMIVRLAGTGQRGAAISVLDSPGTIVVHNTALLSGTSSVAIDYAHPDTQNVYIANNLADAARGRTGCRVGHRRGQPVDGRGDDVRRAGARGPASAVDAARAAIDQGVFTTYADRRRRAAPPGWCRPGHRRRRSAALTSLLRMRPEPCKSGR